jgi:hypothetical protein
LPLILVGTVEKWSDQAMCVIIDKLPKYIYWPVIDERFDIKIHIKALHGIPQCLSYINGSHINLERAPTRPQKNTGPFHRRKERYSFNIVAVIDDKNRFCYLH